MQKGKKMEIGRNRTAKKEPFWKETYYGHNCVLIVYEFICAINLFIRKKHLPVITFYLYAPFFLKSIDIYKSIYLYMEYAAPCIIPILFLIILIRILWNLSEIFFVFLFFSFNLHTFSIFINIFLFFIFCLTYISHPFHFHFL